VLRNNLIALVRCVDSTRDWLMDVEEKYGSLDHQVALMRSAFAVGALPRRRPRRTGPSVHRLITDGGWRSRMGAARWWEPLSSSTALPTALERLHRGS
jgi:hypothetical protein